MIGVVACSHYPLGGIDGMFIASLKQIANKKNFNSAIELDRLDYAQIARFLNYLMNVN